MCSLQPSVTLYGTEQVSTTRTITHSQITTYLGEPLISLSTQTITDCPAGRVNCTPEVRTSLVTLTPTVTSTIFSLVTKATVVGRVVPQQTLFYPCTTSPPVEGAGGESKTGREEMKQSEAHQTVDASTFSSPVPAPVVIPSSSTWATTSASSNAPPSPTSRPETVPTVTPPSTIARAASAPLVSTSSATSVSPFRLLPSTSATSNIGVSSQTAGLSESTSSAKSSPATGSVIAGSIIGGLLALILLGTLLVCYRRRHRKISSAQSGGTEEYWERRFRELEADEKLSTSQRGSGGPDAIEREGGWATGGFSKKVRLTLDLKSKGMSSRPASRLSAISAFFAKSHPAPFDGASPGTGPHVNFSRPRFGKRFSRASTGSRGDVDLGGTGSAAAIRRSRGQSVKSLSTWLNFSTAPGPNGAAVTVSPATQAGAFQSRVARASEDNGDVSVENRGMEWMRPHDTVCIDAADDQGKEEELSRVVSVEDNGGYPSARFLKRWSEAEASPITSIVPGSHATTAAVSPRSPSTPDLLPAPIPFGNAASSSSPVPAPSPSGRRLTPPQRSIGTDRSLNAPPPAFKQPNQMQSRPSQGSLVSVYSTPSSEPSFSTSRPVTCDLLPPVPILHPRIASLTKDASSSPSLYPAPPGSFSGQREFKGKTPPQLQLSREAITPSLWIDDDLYERFERTEQSRFSPDSSAPPMSVVGNEDPYGGIADIADNAVTPVSASTFGGSVEDASFGWATRGERSAVTPQLPMVQLCESSRISMGWSRGDEQERMKTMYQQD